MTTRAQRRLIGEAGPEAIIPLHKLPDLLRQAGAGRGGGGVAVSLNIGSVGGGFLDLPPADQAHIISEHVRREIAGSGGLMRHLKGRLGSTL